jgi:hypothetical protein
LDITGTLSHGGYIAFPAGAPARQATKEAAWGIDATLRLACSGPSLGGDRRGRPFWVHTNDFRLGSTQCFKALRG